LSEQEKTALAAAIGKLVSSEIAYMIDLGVSIDIDCPKQWSLQEMENEQLTGRSIGLHESDDGDEDLDFVPMILRTGLSTRDTETER